MGQTIGGNELTKKWPQLVEFRTPQCPRHNAIIVEHFDPLRHHPRRQPEAGGFFRTRRAFCNPRCGLNLAIKTLRAIDDKQCMKQMQPTGRWLAAAAAVTGLIVLLASSAQEPARIGAVLPASAMFVGGAVLFARLSTSPDTWERAVHGPTARRFLAVGVAIAALLAIITMLLLLSFLLTPAA